MPPTSASMQGTSDSDPATFSMSARNLNTIFIIEKASGEVVWQYSKELDRQHEAVMSPKRGPVAGTSGLEQRTTRTFVYRRSRVRVINPVTEEIVWQYRSSNFFTSVAAQPSPCRTTTSSYLEQRWPGLRNHAWSGTSCGSGRRPTNPCALKVVRRSLSATRGHAPVGKDQSQGTRR